MASLDPLGLCPPNESLDVNPEARLNVGEEGRYRLGKHPIDNLDELESGLVQIYTGKIGYEVGHVENAQERAWLYETIEAMTDIHASPALRRHMAKILLQSEVLDQFMAKRFGQVKRYGLEGSEAMMVAMEILLGLSKSEHVVIAMPHRGRLNLMVNLLGYPPEALFHKLTGASELPNDVPGTADVLSHLCNT